MHTTLITIPIVHQAYPNLLQLPKSHISNHFTPFILINFTPILIFTICGRSYAEPMLVPKMENFHYYRRPYTRSYNSVFQTPAINFGKKTSSSQRRIQHLPKTFAEQGNQVKI